MQSAEVLRDLAGQLQALIRLVARPWRLSSTQALILFTLPLDGIPHSDLARRLGLDASTITRVVVKMQTAGLVERLRSTDDRRVFLVTPTGLGRKLRRSLQDRWEQEIRTVLEGMDTEHRESLDEHLEELSWLLLKNRS